jgi:hypothetical protein
MLHYADHTHPCRSLWVVLRLFFFLVRKIKQNVMLNRNTVDSCPRIAFVIQNMFIYVVYVGYILLLFFFKDHRILVANRRSAK